MPSDHGLVNVETRSPRASSWRRSSATAPLTVYRIKRSNWSRRCAGMWVLACSENPWTLAQRGLVSAGRSPAYPKPEPIRRTCCPTRSPKARHCFTEAAVARASSGSSLKRILQCGERIHRKQGRRGRPHAWGAPSRPRTPSTPAGGHASPRALACRPARRGCLARAPRSQAEHGAAWLWFVLDMCLRMG